MAVPKNKKLNKRQQTQRTDEASVSSESDEIFEEEIEEGAVAESEDDEGAVTGEEDEDIDDEDEEDEQPKPWMDYNPPKDAVILGPNDPIKVTGELVGGNSVIVDKMVVRAVTIPRTRGYKFILIHNKGARVSVNRVNAVNGVTTRKTAYVTARTIDQIKLPNPIPSAA